MRETVASNQTGMPPVDEVAVANADRRVRFVISAILIVVVLLLTVIIYGLLAGVINPPAPRTAQEFVLARALESIEASPTNGQFWADYVDVLVVREEYTEAAKIVARARKAVGTHRSIFLVNNAELNMLIAQKQFKKALDASEKSLALDKKERAKVLADYAAKGVTVPDTMNAEWTATTVETLSYRAAAAVGLKDYDTAIEALTEALDQDAMASDLAAFRGNVFILKGDKKSLEEARLDFLWALRFIPDYEAALEGLARVEKLTGVETSADTYRKVTGMSRRAEKGATVETTTP